MSPSASLTIDNYILSQEDEETKQFVKDLKEDLIQYEFYNAINRFELEILKINKEKLKITLHFCLYVHIETRSLKKLFLLLKEKTNYIIKNHL